MLDGSLDKNLTPSIDKDEVVKMTKESKEQKHNRPRILIFSQRNIFPNDLWRCPLYEFEDIVCEIDTVDILAPRSEKWFSLGNRISNRVARSYSIALNPGISKIKLTNYYDMLFTICSFPKDLLNFQIDKSWKDYCKTSICLVDEIWANQLTQQECYLKILSKFDYVMLYYSQSVKPINKLIGDKCLFLPPGIDALLFCPYPEPPKRFVDVYSVGRRSAVTHQALLKMAKEHKIFYVHDTIAGTAINSKEHRFLLANMAKRSRFYIVNPGLIDQPEIRGNQMEIPNRYFEGAASGTIMIGEIPKNEEFEKLFHWPDAVIQLPFDSDKVATMINELDKQPDREERIHRNNVVWSLRQHDWLYRWETILKAAGLNPMPALLERKKQLENLARFIQNETNAF